MDGEEECRQCGGTDRTPEDGTLFCASCGYSLGPVAYVAEDEQDYQQRGKTVRKKEQRVKQRPTKIYRGRKGYRLFLQAWQHILWRQCHAVIHTCELPTDLWNVVKDLWTLRLTKLVYRFEPTNLHATAKVSEAGASSPGSESESETNMSASENDEAQVHSKSSGEPSSSPKLIDTVALLYLGTLLLRYPLRLGLLYDWILTETIPFIRPVRHVPADIRNHLASEYDRALDTASIPKPRELQLAVLRMAGLYSTAFGMSLPPLNSAPLMMTFVEQLALPLQVYNMARQVNKIVAFGFGYPTEWKSRRTPATYPEAHLMSLIVIATKLLLPFDSDRVNRHPISLNEPGALHLDWDRWMEAKARFEEVAETTREEALLPGSEISMQDVRVMEMTDEQLDQYMDWYQGTFARVKDRPEEGLSKQVLDMFPITMSSETFLEGRLEKYKQRVARMETLRAQRLQDVLGGLTTNQPITEEDEDRILEELQTAPLRPGAAYQKFRDVQALNGPAKLFHEEAAALACLSVDQLIRAVTHTEQTIERWRRAQRRSEIWPDEIDAGTGAL